MTRDRLARAAGLLYAVALLAAKAHQAPVFPGPLDTPLWPLRAAVWTLEGLIAVGYLAAFATRLPAKSLASGYRETAVPVLVALLPIAVTASPYTLPELVPIGSPWHTPLHVLAFLLLVGGETLNLWGLFVLRRSFSVMAEARALVTAGPFALMRHPLYSGHFVAFLGYVVLHWSAATAALYALFVAGQVYRARLEEEKLERSFPEYAAYKRRVPMFLPSWR